MLNEGALERLENEYKILTTEFEEFLTEKAQGRNRKAFLGIMLYYLCTKIFISAPNEEEAFDLIQIALEHAYNEKEKLKKAN
jgi:hypothetical protein